MHPTMEKVRLIACLGAENHARIVAHEIALPFAFLWGRDDPEFLGHIRVRADRFSLGYHRARLGANFAFFGRLSGLHW